MDLEYYEISVPDRNDSIMRVNLDEVYYNLRLTWNAYGGFWMLSIYDAEMNIILGMARLVPGTIWNFYYQTQGFCGWKGKIVISSCKTAWSVTDGHLG